MAKLTKETSGKSSPPSLRDLRKYTYSQALADGLTHSGWLIGPKIDQSGQALALASHSVPLDNVKELTMRGTYGPLFGGLSPSADLQESLANKLQAAMDVNGSPEYVLTWKQWDIGSGVPICALRASPRPTSDKGFGGWRSQQAGDADHGGPNARDSAGSPHLTSQAAAGWQTPKLPSGGACERNTSGGGLRKLEDQAILTGWPTVAARDWKDGRCNQKTWDKNTRPLNEAAVNLIGWDTPHCPRAHDSDNSKSTYLERSILGVMQSGMNVEMAKAGGFLLNPKFSLWLQGYSAEWAYCGVRAMRLCRKSRRSS